MHNASWRRGSRRTGPGSIGGFGGAADKVQELAVENKVGALAADKDVEAEATAIGWGRGRG